MKQIIFSILLFSPLIVYGQDYQESLYFQLDTVFEKEEIAILSEMVIFFDSIIVSTNGEDDVGQAYHIFMENLRYNTSANEFKSKVSVIQDGIDDMISTFSKYDVFYLIIEKDYLFHYPSMDTAAYEYNSKMEGAYVDILEIAKQINPTFIEYHEHIKIFTPTSPSLMSGFQHIHEELSLDNELIRLIVMLHYISNFSYKEI